MPLEYLGTVTAIVKLASQALQSGFLQTNKRQKAAQEVKQQFTAFVSNVKSEGRKIETYVKFERLISVVDRGVNTILRMENVNEDDQVFWQNVQEVHAQFYEAATVELQNFNLLDFEPVHQGEINGVRPLIQQKIQTSHAQMDAKQRPEFVNTLRDTAQMLGRVRGFGSMILESTGRTLSGYGGEEA